MQIIADLEGTTRGPYGGCVGYFSFNGNLDTCITVAVDWFFHTSLTLPAATLSRSSGRGKTALLKDGKAAISSAAWR